MNVNGKYLKDENNTIFSPITSMDSIYDSSSNDLISCLKGTVLFEGDSVQGTITLTDTPSNYRYITIINRRNRE